MDRCNQCYYWKPLQIVTANVCPIAVISSLARRTSAQPWQMCDHKGTEGPVIMSRTLSYHGAHLDVLIHVKVFTVSPLLVPGWWHCIQDNPREDGVWWMNPGCCPDQWSHSGMDIQYNNGHKTGQRLTILNNMTIQDLYIVSRSQLLSLSCFCVKFTCTLRRNKISESTSQRRIQKNWMEGQRDWGHFRTSRQHTF